MIQLGNRVGRVLAGIVAILIAIQLIPYGRNHTNPSISMEPTWASPEVRTLAVRACFACHSNQTTWPWYSNVAPVSWLVQSDVDRGRHELNFSEWDHPQREVRRSARTVQEGEMPQWYYVMLHPQAKLSPAERQTLVQGFEVMFVAGVGRGR